MSLKAILVGLGRMGSQWAAALKESNDYETVAYVDPSTIRRDALRRKLKLDSFPGFGTVREALRSVAADVAVVATTAFTHHEVTVEVLANRLPTIVEKPIETDWDKAREMVAEAERRGVLLLVDQNFRYTAPFVTLRRVLQEGTMGRPGFATVIQHRNRKGAGTYQQNMPHPMLLDMSEHHLDAMRFVFAREAVSVLAHAWNPSWSDYTHEANVDIVIEFAGDIWVTYSGSNVSRGISIHPFGNWRIECEDGGVYLESSGYELELFRVPVGSPPQHREPIEFDPMPLQNQACVLQHFKDCLENAKELETSGRDNLKTLAIAMAAIASSARGERVCVSEFLNQS